MRDPGTLSSWMWQTLAATVVASCAIFLVAVHFVLGVPETALLTPAALQLPLAMVVSPLFYWGLSREFSGRGDIKPMLAGIGLLAIAEAWICYHYAARVGLISWAHARGIEITSLVMTPPALVIVYYIDRRYLRRLRLRSAPRGDRRD
jgi:hypothetical protein